MKRLDLLSICVALISFTFVAQSQPPEEILKEHSVKWMKALEARDSTTLNNYLAAEFTLSPAGNLQKVDRSTWLKNALEKKWTNTKYHFFDIRMKGSNTAIVNTKLSFKVNPVPFTITSDIIDHWVYRNDRWQVTDRFIGGDTFTSIISTATGLILGIILVGLIIWIKRFFKKRKKKNAVAADT